MLLEQLYIVLYFDKQSYYFQLPFFNIESMSCTPSETGIRLAEGETATFVATVTYYGNTEPALYWYKGNQRIDSSTSSVVGDQYTTMT